ncbi:MAG: CHAD domain-containing protein [Blastocatellia bacterium]|nr:CHAD domain-containing protein [Blastocatellia bacterium]
MARPLKIKKVLPSDPIDKAAVRILRTRLKEFYSHWPDPGRDPTPEELHNLRISGKRLRYSAECLSELYPDKLALLIEMLKRSQDLLGAYQDCIVQQRMIEEDLERLRVRDGRSKDIPVLEELIAKYEKRRTHLFAQFRRIWLGMSSDEFRHSLKKMITNIKTEQDEPHLKNGTQMTQIKRIFTDTDITRNNS